MLCYFIRKIFESHSRQLNYLQNDVCFSHLARKLGDEVFSEEKAIFQVEGKTRQYELCNSSTPFCLRSRSFRTDFSVHSSQAGLQLSECFFFSHPYAVFKYILL